jgi:hypothetical protein
MVTLNGRTKGDLIGQFTCQTYNGASVVDYVIVSQDLLSSIVSFSVADITEFSHHSYLSFVIRIETPNVSQNDLKLTSHPTSFLWDENQKNYLRECINSQDVQNRLDSFFSQTTTCERSADVDALVNSTTVLNIKKQKNTINKNIKNKTKVRQKWYDANCHNLKRNLSNIGKLLSKDPNNIFIRHLFFAKRKEYKRMVKKQKRQFYNSLLNKIEMLSDNPKEFWKLVNDIKTRKSCTSNEISSSEWFDYFKNLNKINFNTEKSSTEAQIVRISTLGQPAKTTPLIIQSQLRNYINYQRN